MKYPFFLFLFFVFLTTSSEVAAQDELDEVLSDIGNEDIPVPRIPFEELLSDTNKVYEIVEVDQEASFPGGQDSLYRYISKNMVYPEYAVKNGIEGRVIVQFIINSEGKTKDIQILKGVHPLLDREAIRVIKTMPLWIPGEKKEKKVSVEYRLPIQFKL